MSKPSARKAQYSALKLTSEYIQNRMLIISRLMKDTPGKAVLFLGSGSSYSVSKSCAAIYRDMTGGAAFAFSSGDVMLNAERYAACAENAVVIAISRSGSTSELLCAIKALKEYAQVKVIAITCVEEAPINELADFVLSMPWAFDSSVCQTRTVSNLYLAGALIGAGICGRADVIKKIEAGLAGLEEYAERIEQDFLMIAKERWNFVAVLADGEMEGICEEGALAFKEICQIHSNSYGLLDCRHGPMVLFGSGTLIIAAVGACGDHEQKLVADLCAKGAIVLTVSDLPCELPGAAYNFAYGAELDPIVRGLAVLIVCQYASYYKALVRGVNPDAPAGLDAWIKL